MRKKILHTDYPYTEIANGVYCINEFDAANCYLLVGSEKAMLIDVGTGFGDLLGFVRTLTDKPLIVAATHVHPDHLGGMGQFDEIFVTKTDVDFGYKFYTSMTVRKFFLLANRKIVPLSVKVKDIPKYKKKPKLLPLENGQTFDLGGKTVTARALAGHTRGSVTFVDEEDKLMFVGDMFSPSLWLYLPNSASVSEWYASGKAIRELANDYTAFWGHEAGRIGTEIMDTDLRLAEEVISRYPKNKRFSLVKVYPQKAEMPYIIFRTGNVQKK